MRLALCDPSFSHNVNIARERASACTHNSLSLTRPTHDCRYDAIEAEKAAARGDDGVADMTSAHIAQTAKKRKADSKKDKAGAKKFKF